MFVYNYLYCTLKFWSKFLGNFYAMFKVGKCKEILKESKTSREMCIGMEPSSNLKN